MFRKIHQIIWIGPVHLDVMGIWNIVQGGSGKCLFYLTFMFHTWIPIHYFWRDVTFCKQIAWELSALFWWYKCLLKVDVRLGIRALKPVLVWFRQSTVLNLDDDVWWALVACTRDSGSSFFLLIILLLLVGELHMITVILYTIYWCPFGNWWGFLTFCKITDALSWHLANLGSSVGWLCWEVLVGLTPWRGAALPVWWPLGHAATCNTKCKFKVSWETYHLTIKAYL